MSFPIRSRRPRAWLRRGLGAALWLGWPPAPPRSAGRGRRAPARARPLAGHRRRLLACHTQAGGGKPYAGGYPINSPLGVIYASNITPSRRRASATTARRILPALREGVRKDGARLYPAMPYTSYIDHRRGHEGAVRLFHEGRGPVDEPAPVTRLPFPFSVRASMLGWNLLFLDNRRYTPDPSKSEQSTVAPIWPMRWRIAAAAIRRATRSWPRTPAARWAVARRAVVRAEHQLGSRRWHRRLVGGRTGAVPAHRPRRRQGQAGGMMAEAVENSFSSCPRRTSGDRGLPEEHRAGRPRVRGGQQAPGRDRL